MPTFIYRFSELHPETYARCLENNHLIVFWHGERLLCEGHVYRDMPGNLLLNLPENLSAELKEGRAQFEITEKFVNDIAPTFLVTGRLVTSGIEQAGS